MSAANGPRPTYDNRITTGNVITIVAILVPLLVSIFAFFLNYEHRLTAAEAAIPLVASGLGGRIDGIQQEIATRVVAAALERDEIRRRITALEEWRTRGTGPPRAPD